MRSLSLTYIVLFLAFIGTLGAFQETFTTSNYQDTFNYIGSGFSRQQPPSFFNEQEANHMKDVRMYITIAYVLFMISIFFVCREQDYLKLVQQTSLSLLILIIIGVLFSFMNFSSFWTGFHKVLFPQGNWQFPADSTIIKLFPEIFFQQFTFIFAKILVIVTIIMYIMTHPRLLKHLQLARR